MRILLILFLTLFQGTFSGAQERFRKIPNIPVQTRDGEMVKLSKVIRDDQIRVISFWATWCKPCLAELAAFSENYKDWAETYNLEIYAISLDDQRAIERAKSYARTKEWEFPVYFDAAKASLTAFNFQNIPYTIVLDPEGNVVYSHNAYLDGDEAKMEAQLEEISTP